jgi:hypothetical protein
LIFFAIDPHASNFLFVTVAYYVAL